MTIESLIHAIPFKPFSFMMADGRKLPVPHRDFITFNGEGRTAIITDEDDGFDLLVVVSLHYEGSGSKADAEAGTASR